MLIIGILIGLSIGCLLTNFINNSESRKNHLIYRAIEKNFQVKRNQFSLEYIPDENGYLVSMKDTEYLVKLTNRKPYKVVYKVKLQS